MRINKEKLNILIAKLFYQPHNVMKKKKGWLIDDDS